MSWVIGMIFWPPSTLASAMAPTASTKVSRKPMMMPGMESGSSTSRKTCQRRGAEIAGGLARLVRHHGDAERHREQHEGQVDVDHAEQDDAGA